MGLRAGDAESEDSAWFEALYRASYRDVLQYARRRVSAAEADDVVAEVFTTVWRRRGEVTDFDRAWLLRTAGNYLLHAYRGADRRARLERRLTGVVPVVQVSQADRDQDPALESAMSRLSDTDQELLRLSAWEQLEPVELAAVLECSPAAVRVRLHRARRRLAMLLAEGISSAVSGSEIR